MEIKPYKNYSAKINYHRTDDLKEGSPKNGLDVIVSPMWIADEGENFAGEWIFSVEGYSPWLPERDLIIISELLNQAQ